MSKVKKEEVSGEDGISYSRVSNKDNGARTKRENENKEREVSLLEL